MHMLCKAGASIFKGLGSWPPDFGQGAVGVVDGSWNIISYDVQEVYSKMVTFEEK